MKVTASKKTIAEIRKKTGRNPPKISNIKYVDHDKFMETIQNENTVLVCMPDPTPEFPDNLQGECSECGCDIYYRPYNSEAKKKVCIRCANKIIEKEKLKNKKH